MIDATAATARHARPLPQVLSAAWSAVTLVLGLWWWTQPDRYPFVPGTPDPSGTVLDVMPAAVVPPVLVVAGLCGLGVAALARQRRADALVVGAGTVLACVFGLAVPGLQPVMLAGYMMAMFGPVVLFGTVLAGAWRRRGGPAAVAAFVLVGAVAWLTGLADAEVLRRYAGVIGATAGKAGAPGALLFFLVGGLTWATLALRTAQRVRAGSPAPAWTRPEAAARWGRVAAIVAAACALPYGLLRMSWLTPWPIGGSPAELATSPEMRLHGLLLGLAALAGAVLTTGLVARWGEVWPRWMPVVRGRRVPVAAAVVPGTLVAALFTVAAVPMVAMMIGSGELWGVLVFPFPIWGPALGMAVLGYALRRQGEPDRPGTLAGR
jgi:hypothetical protein